MGDLASMYITSETSAVGASRVSPTLSRLELRKADELGQSLAFSLEQAVACFSALQLGLH